MQEYRSLDTERPKPRVNGTRIDVIQLWDAVQSVEGGVEAVAARWDVSVEAVREAVRYYEAHTEELETVRREQREDAAVARELQRQGLI